ncbi:hypothetical protein [Actinocorallia sp. A-T 12471]|uniref:hypothetical protein n=1 Tax=Actinocorallia sp. A-T 12471 TaxID=3089813 RepID=UPI0029CEFE3B|nr:hypothetical protein [Actinocorallia sp. A-T 12471]MDX6744472.1 hypothetical protein [Actinocorallia sp. A-T 12471]
MGAVLGLMVESSGWVAEGREYIGFAAAVGVAMIAGQAGWKATDWVLERRGARDAE